MARTRGTQRKLLGLTVALAAVSVALLLWRKEVGVLGFVVTVIVAGAGFWITSSHLADWRHRLEHLRRAPKQPPVVGGARRF